MHIQRNYAVHLIAQSQDQQHEELNFSMLLITFSSKLIKQFAASKAFLSRYPWLIFFFHSKFSFPPTLRVRPP